MYNYYNGVDIMIFLDLANCGPAGLLRVIYFIKLIFEILFILIPICLIILLIIDFSKMVVSNDEGAQKKIFNLTIKRIISAILVYFVPLFVNIFNIVLGTLGVEFSHCYTDVTLDAINVLEAEEIAIREAKEEARIAAVRSEREKAEEEKKKRQEALKATVSGSGCDGHVLYENGVFYKPSTATSGSDGTKGSAKYGYNKYFYDMLSKLISDGEKAGYVIRMSNTEYGAWRPLANQQYFWNCYKTKSCNNGNLAAVPGYSNHGWGIASDLSYGSNAAINWAHKNASKYGLNFSEPSENWHIEPSNIQKNDSKVAVCK